MGENPRFLQHFAGTKWPWCGSMMAMLGSVLHQNLDLSVLKHGDAHRCPKIAKIEYGQWKAIGFCSTLSSNKPESNRPCGSQLESRCISFFITINLNSRLISLFRNVGTFKKKQWFVSNIYWLEHECTTLLSSIHPRTGYPVDPVECRPLSDLDLNLTLSPRWLPLRPSRRAILQPLSSNLQSPGEAPSAPPKNGAWQSFVYQFIPGMAMPKIRSHWGKPSMNR